MRNLIIARIEGTMKRRPPIGTSTPQGSQDGGEFVRNIVEATREQTPGASGRGVLGVVEIADKHAASFGEYSVRKAEIIRSTDSFISPSQPEGIGTRYVISLFLAHLQYANIVQMRSIFLRT